MTSRCLDRKEVRHATLRAHTGTGTLVGALCTHIRRLFLSFGGPVCVDRISNCPLDRVLTYKNLIYLLNLQVYVLQNFTFCGLYETLLSTGRPVNFVTPVKFVTRRKMLKDRQYSHSNKWNIASFNSKIYIYAVTGQ